MLLILEEANLFLIPLDHERRWYRYHHLFADFLRQRLRETQPDIMPELFVRASGWFEAQGMLDEAFHHALVGDDVRRAARLLDENVETLILSGAAVNQVLRWAKELPVDVRAEFPRLCIYHAWALQFEYQLDSVEPTLALAETHLRDTTKLPASFPPSQITGHADAIRAYTALRRGEVDRAVDLLLAALKTLTEEEAGKEHPAGKAERSGRRHPAKEVLALRGIIKLGLGIGYLNLGQMEAAYQSLQSALPLNQRTGNRYGALSCIHHLIYVNLARGELNRAYANGETGLLWIEEWSSSEGRLRRPARMLAHSRWQMGRVQYERNDLNEAAGYLHKAIEYYELVGSWWRVQGYARLVDLHQALGDVTTALSYLQRLKHISLTPDLSLPDFPLAALIAERSLLLSRARPDLGDLFAEAVAWGETSGLKPDDDIRYGQEYEYLTLARVLIAQNRAGEAIPLIDRLITAAEGAGRNGDLIAYLSLQAVAHHTQGKTDTALPYLSRALALGEPEGYVRSFVHLGPPMRDLLGTLSRQPSAVSQTYIDRLLAAFGDTTMDEGPKTKPRPSSLAPGPSSPVLRRPPSEPRGRPPSVPRGEAEGLVEPLSDREKQILHLLAARRSYREIAEELYLSLNTIKWYTKNIYGKLGVHKRAEAVSRARELGIL
jgi:LuxR family maltose regulon positive regulatory protein